MLWKAAEKCNPFIIKIINVKYYWFSHGSTINRMIVYEGLTPVPPPHSCKGVLGSPCLGLTIGGMDTQTTGYQWQQLSVDTKLRLKHFCAFWFQMCSRPKVYSHIWNRANKKCWKIFLEMYTTSQIHKIGGNEWINKWRNERMNTTLTTALIVRTSILSLWFQTKIKKIKKIKNSLWKLGNFCTSSCHWR